MSTTYQKLAIARQHLLDKLQENMEGTGCPPSCSIRKRSHLMVMEAQMTRAMKRCGFDAHSEEAEELNNRILWDKVQAINIPQDAINELIAPQYLTGLGKESQAQLAFNIWYGARKKGVRLDPLPDHIIERLKPEARAHYWEVIK